jgi:hypothetical protein
MVPRQPRLRAAHSLSFLIQIFLSIQTVLDKVALQIRSGADGISVAAVPVAAVRRAAVIRLRSFSSCNPTLGFWKLAGWR